MTSSDQCAASRFQLQETMQQTGVELGPRGSRDPAHESTAPTTVLGGGSRTRCAVPARVSRLFAIPGGLHWDACDSQALGPSGERGTQSPELRAGQRDSTPRKTLGGGERSKKHSARTMAEDAQMAGWGGHVPGLSSQGLAGASPIPLPRSVFGGATPSLENNPGVGAITGKCANTTSQAARGFHPRGHADRSPWMSESGPGGERGVSPRPRKPTAQALGRLHRGGGRSRRKGPAACTQWGDCEFCPGVSF